nr:hypothetical protein [Tanacetum cinerariifolium]GEW60387.1 hypothetical protein [Tanacetum cinerariifolium]
MAASQKEATAAKIVAKDLARRFESGKAEVSPKVSEELATYIGTIAMMPNLTQALMQQYANMQPLLGHMGGIDPVGTMGPGVPSTSNLIITNDMGGTPGPIVPTGPIPPYVPKKVAYSLASRLVSN